MKLQAALSLIILTMVSFPSWANQNVFETIANEASVGNGWSQVSNYDRSLSEGAVQSQGKLELESDYWEGCGPWKVITDQREAIKEIKSIEDFVGEETGDEETRVARLLQVLDDDGQIFAVVGAISNNSVECSLSWFNIYGTDGSKLVLRYGLGD